MNRWPIGLGPPSVNMLCIVQQSFSYFSLFLSDVNCTTHTLQVSFSTFALVKGNIYTVTKRSLNLVVLVLTLFAHNSLATVRRNTIQNNSRRLVLMYQPLHSCDLKKYNKKISADFLMISCCKKLSIAIFFSKISKVTKW